MAVDIFLKLDTLIGNSTAKDHEGWFVVHDYEFDLSRVIDIGSGGQTTTSNVGFSPLLLDFDLGQTAIAQILTKAGGSGVDFSNVTLALRNTGASVDFETITLTNASVSGYGERSGFASRLALNYATIKVEIQTFDGLGGVVADQQKTFTYDLIHATTEITPATPTELLKAFYPISPVTTLDLEPVVASTTKTEQFLKITNIAGSSTAEEFPDHFEVLNYDFDLLGSLVSGNAVTGAEASPLIIDLAAYQSGLATMLSMSVTGGDLGDVVLNVRKAGSSAAFETITLKHAQILSISEADGFASRVALGYLDIEIKISEIDAKGQVVTSQIFETDNGLNGEGKVQTKFRPLTEAELQASLVHDAKVDVFLKAGAIDGGSTDAQHKGEFEVLGYSFDIEGLLQVTAAGGKAGGLPSFEPLYVDLYSGTAGIANLLKTVGTGIPDVQLTVERTGKDIAIETIKLNGVHVISYDEQPGLASRVGLGYDTVTITVTDVDIMGAAGTPVTFTFDQDGKNAVFEGIVETDRVSTVADLASTDTFMTLGAIAGPSANANHKGAFDVVNYELDLQSLFAIGADGKASPGTPEFAPLLIDIAPGTAGIADILGKFQGVEELGDVTLTRARGGETPVDFETITLTGAYVIGYAEESGFASRVALGYKAISVSNADVDGSGKPGTPVVFDFDLAKNGSSFRPLSEAELAPAINAGTTHKMFLNLTGIAGASTDNTHKGAFGVLGYSFDLDREFDPNGGDLLLSNTEFSPLVVDISSGQSGLAAIISEMAKGSVIPTATLIVAHPDGSGGSTDFETITLTNAKVVSYQEHDNFASRVALSYTDIKVSVADFDAQGQLLKAHVYDNVVETIVLETPDLSSPLTPSERNDLQFLRLGDINGGSLNATFKGQFDIENYTFDLQALQGNSTFGNVDVAPLVVDFQSGQPALTELLARTAGGRSIPDAVLTLATGFDQGNPLAYEIITLQNVTVIGYEDNGDFTTSVTLGYGRLGIQISDITNQGALGKSFYTVDLKTNDFVVGDDGDNTLDGGDGDDTLLAGDGRDVVRGGNNNDRIIGGTGLGDDFYDGGPGVDLVEYPSALAGIAVNLNTQDRSTFVLGDADGGAGPNPDTVGDLLVLNGLAATTPVGIAFSISKNAAAIGVDVLLEIENVLGGGFADAIAGNDLDNEIEGGAGGDTIDGGGGSDTASYASSKAGVVIDLLFSTYSGGDAVGDTLTSIENVRGSANTDTIYGNNDANKIFGGEGDDILEGEGGADRLDGEGGIDTASYVFSFAGVNVNLLSGAASGGTAEGDTFFSIENLTGSNQTDQLTGNGLDNRIDGGDGDDALDGGFGFDFLNGGSGVDTVDYRFFSKDIKVSDLRPA